MLRNQNKTSAERETNSENECCIKKQKRPPPTYQNPRSVRINNFLEPLSDLSVENEEKDSEGDSTKTPETHEMPDKGRPPPIVFTSEANLIGLWREIKRVVSKESVFRNTESGTLITNKSVVHYNPIKISSLTKSPLTFYIKHGYAS
jgi:hypothetical protein